MSSKLVFALFFFVISFLLLSAHAFNHGDVKANQSVYNVNTGLSYAMIQEAINAIETLDGHTILVEEGTYYEHIVVNKSLSLVGANPSETIIDGAHSGNVVNIIADNVKITGFTVQNSGDDSSYGIYSTSNINNVSYNTIINNGNGIKLYKSSNNSITGNNIVNNDYGIKLSWHSNSNSISENVLVDNNRGIALSFYSDSNSISKNNITKNEYGIFLHSCSNSFLQDNILNNNQYGFGVEGFELNHYLVSIDTSNLVDNKPIYYLINQQKLTINTSTHPQIGFLALINSTNISIKNISLTKSKQGILLAYTNNTKVQNNIITNNDDGIYLYNSSNNTISLNNVTANNDDGIKLYESSNNSISENNIITNNYDGIFLSRSSNNTISLNNVTANNDDGIKLYNFCNRNHISGNNITNNKYGLALIPHSDCNTISENDILDNKYGLQLSTSSNNTISKNNITTNIDYGIYLHESSNNSFTGNNIAGNNIGIRFQSSSGNIVYGNNIADNTENVYDDAWDPFESHHPTPSINTWDNGYTEGGNYWSDFKERYPDATELNNSGIWDTPYIIDNNNKDNYPIIPEFSSKTILFTLMITMIVVVINIELACSRANTLKKRKG